jgi:hypothetical protein
MKFITSTLGVSFIRTLRYLLSAGLGRALDYCGLGFLGLPLPGALLMTSRAEGSYRAS